MHFELFFIKNEYIYILINEKIEKTEIEFKVEKQLDVKIWSNLKNTKNYLPPTSKLNDAQKNELNSINKAFEKQLNDLGLKTYHKAIGKTEAGYTFVRICKQKDCKAYVNLRIKVTKGTGAINYEEKCKQRH